MVDYYCISYLQALLLTTQIVMKSLTMINLDLDNYLLATKYVDNIYKSTKSIYSNLQ